MSASGYHGIETEHELSHLPTGMEGFHCIEKQKRNGLLLSLLCCLAMSLGYRDMMLTFSLF
jgi:hypothetical protein